MIRRIFALIGLLAGLWLFHEVSFYQGVLASRGVGDLAALFADVPFLIRFIGAVFLCIGAALAFRLKWIGPAIFLVGSLCYVLLALAMVAMGADVSLWQDEAVIATGLIRISICFGLFRTT